MGACVQGLGYPALSQMRVSPPFFTLLQEGTLPQSLFSIWLNPNPLQLDAGQITFGAIDKSRYSGSIAYLPSVSNTYVSHLMPAMLACLFCTAVRAMAGQRSAAIMFPGMYAAQHT